MGLALSHTHPSRSQQKQWQIVTVPDDPSGGLGDETAGNPTGSSAQTGRQTKTTTADRFIAGLSASAKAASETTKAATGAGATNIITVTAHQTVTQKLPSAYQKRARGFILVHHVGVLSWLHRRTKQAKSLTSETSPICWDTVGPAELDSSCLYGCLRWEQGSSVQGNLDGQCGVWRVKDSLSCFSVPLGCLYQNIQSHLAAILQRLDIVINSWLGDHLAPNFKREKPLMAEHSLSAPLRSPSSMHGRDV